MRKARVTIINIWAVTLAIVLLPAYFLIFSHDVSLWQTSRSLTAINHPLQTKHIAFSNDLGLLIGNGNHCDYFVAELRSYDEFSPKQIENFYKNTRIWNPLNRRKEHVSIGTIENGRIKSNENWTGTENFLRKYFKANLPQNLNGQKLYFVFLLDVVNGTGIDGRCM